jgi:hypothetical protein
VCGAEKLATGQESRDDIEDIDSWIDAYNRINCVVLKENNEALKFKLEILNTVRKKETMKLRCHRQ